METPPEEGLIQQHIQQRQQIGSVYVNADDRDGTVSTINENLSTSHRPVIYYTDEYLPDETSQIIRGSVFESEHGMVAQGTVRPASSAPTITIAGSGHRVTEVPRLSQDTEQIEEINLTIQGIRENSVNMTEPFAPTSTAFTSIENEHQVGERENILQISEVVDESSQTLDNTLESEYDMNVELINSPASSSSNDNTFIRSTENRLSSNLNPLDTFSEHSEEGESTYLSSIDSANERLVFGASTSSANANSVRSDHEVNLTAESRISYDTNLPTEHANLGSNMSRVPGVNYFEAGQKCMITLFWHWHVLFPGEVLPFLISREILETCRDAQNGLIVGLCMAFSTEGYYYGVTCQIFEKGPRDIGVSDDLYESVKSCAWQRFFVKGSEITGPLQLIDDRPQLMCRGLIEILPEVYQWEPLRYANMGSMNRFRGSDYMKQMFRRYQAAGTAWPVCVYSDYDMSHFIERARSYLANQQVGIMPTEPVRLSFWLGRNLCCSAELKRKLLLTNYVNIRLKLMSDTFDENRVFACGLCLYHIAKCRHMLAMSKYGAQVQYTHIVGEIYEISTVSEILENAVVVSDIELTDCLWFPGYSYRSMSCQACHCHIGWKYSSRTPNIKPEHFFGISSEGVKILPSNISN